MAEALRTGPQERGSVRGSLGHLDSPNLTHLLHEPIHLTVQSTANCRHVLNSLSYQGQLPL